MHTYVKLKDGRIMVLFSDNTTDETMSGYPISLVDTWRSDVDVCENWGYSDVSVTDTNLQVLDIYS